MEYLSMYDIKEGAAAEIAGLNCRNEIKQRFMELGMIKGTKVKCVLCAPFGTIKAYSVAGSVIAIRKKDACDILVREVVL